MAAYKYNEDHILEDALRYIDTTYKSHYVQDGSEGIQVNDLIMALGHGEGSFIANAIKYLSRYGKKDGKNLKDLHKAIHNICLLINQNHYKNVND